MTGAKTMFALQSHGSIWLGPLAIAALFIFYGINFWRKQKAAPQPLHDFAKTYSLKAESLQKNEKARFVGEYNDMAVNARFFLREVESRKLGTLYVNVLKMTIRATTVLPGGPDLKHRGLDEKVGGLFGMAQGFKIGIAEFDKVVFIQGADRRAVVGLFNSERVRQVVREFFEDYPDASLSDSAVNFEAIEPTLTRQALAAMLTRGANLLATLVAAANDATIKRGARADVPPWEIPV